MQAFSSLEAAAQAGLNPLAVCLGNFDGVHLGHRALFSAAKALGQAFAFTFSPHPGKVLQPTLAPLLIQTPRRKLELLSDAGVTGVLQQPFTLEYAKTPPQVFEGALFETLKAKAVVVGADFTYGAKRSGTVETLRAAARAVGARLEVVTPVTVGGVVVSSSKIREYLLEGRVDAAAALLGRPFDFDGEVVRGAGRGRTIGFPTANVATQNELRPGPGVYAVRVRVSGAWHGGAANIGVKPTFGGKELTVEAHLFDFAADLYGQEVRVQFLARLREERRFGSVSELTQQLARDVASARDVVAQAT